FNLFPAYRRSGARLTYIADDWREVRVRLPLNWKTRNYVGTLFGGSMFAAVDPVYMMMLIKVLGSGYRVWDKAGRIEFRRPGRGTLYARFSLPRVETDDILQRLEAVESVERVYSVELTDGDGTVHAVAHRTVHISRARKKAG
ncbi:MAG: DUF4442 domain-containing protein, partial [Desulfuromonadales bacterium]|nr:DUF4442 domain-containing protein [Desulfuromonadales bacterium]NIR34224.1 DUF4442 domain-containing protein [Desulfuromonadales bacterium]NIS44175.1 DUF4442 domain-containing protein [Desulfuromonadales bacterium]